MLISIKRKLEISRKGANLLIIFLVSTFILASLYVLGCMGFLGLPTFKNFMPFWIPVGVVIFLVELVIFWDGIIRIYLASTQLGITLRILGAVFGLLIPVNIILLIYMICIVRREYKFESEKIKINQAREKEELCKTKYPILMLHGIFFRDFKHFNYWGRIPAELERNGAKIYYGNHESAESVQDGGRRIAERIREICEKEGVDKVNIIAHSKGGLESRWAISKEGMADKVACLVTINTPHRGTRYAAHLLKKIPRKHQLSIANIYNRIVLELGDTTPDFLAAVNDLTVEAAEKFNEEVLDSPKVYYISVGSKLNRRRGGRFPLNITYPLVKHYDGICDGLVGRESFPWGDEFRYICTKGRRGVSHGDMIDLNRENIKGFDVREFYVQLVNDLKKKGF